MTDYRRNPYARPSCPQPRMPMPEPTCSQPCPQAPEPTCEEHHRHFPDHFPIGMAYIPWQKWNQTYELDHALHTGTIFPELDKPFKGIRKRGCCK